MVVSAVVTWWQIEEGFLPTFGKPDRSPVILLGENGDTIIEVVSRTMVILPLSATNRASFTPARVNYQLTEMLGCAKSKSMVPGVFNCVIRYSKEDVLLGAAYSQVFIAADFQPDMNHTGPAKYCVLDHWECVEKGLPREIRLGPLSRYERPWVI